MKLIDLSGSRFNRLLVIKISHRDNNGIHWLCECDCGNKNVIVLGQNLRTRKTTSCGCLHSEEVSRRRFIDLTNKKFGRLTVIKRIEDRIQPNGYTVTQWLCLCENDENEVIASSSSLTTGLVTSCGCYRTELIREKHYRDLSGMIFGYLLVLNRVGNSTTPKGQKYINWLCECKCGKIIEICGEYLLCGTKSCGCLSESYMASVIKTYYLNNYNAVLEYKMCKNPKTGYWLYCDIYIPKNNVFIEIHGIQHYSLNTWHVLQSKKGKRNPKEEFEYQKYKDELKENFAKEKGTYIEIDLRNFKTIEDVVKYIGVRL